MSGATITVKSLETSAARTTVSGESGNYEILSLPVGTQELRAEKQGFKAVVRTGINLEVGQEAVANAVKHGRARHVFIELRYAPASVCLTVSDDGQGFAADQASPAGHFGLLDMRERAQSMGSQLIVQSEPGRGTRIDVEVPLFSSEPIDEDLKANTYSGG